MAINNAPINPGSTGSRVSGMATSTIPSNDDTAKPAASAKGWFKPRFTNHGKIVEDAATEDSCKALP